MEMTNDLVDRCSTYLSGRLRRTYYRKCPVCGDIVGRYRSTLSLHGFNRKDFPCAGIGLPWNLADDLNPCGTADKLKEKGLRTMTTKTKRKTRTPHKTREQRVAALEVK